MAVNLAAFVAANAFWQYLARGRWWDFSAAAYRQDLATPLREIFMHPLSIFVYPWMIVVTGLLLAVVIFVPIVVAVLYSLPYGALLAAVVAVIGHAPVLAAVLALGCVLASRTWLRSDMPFLATLLGMVPVAVYLYLFAFLGSDSGAVVPLQRLLLAVPLLIAGVGAILASAVALALAAATGSRPGVVWPVVAVMLAALLSIFFTRVGSDQLEYALIASDLAPGDAVFEPLTLEAWRRENRAEGLNPTTLRIRVQDDLQRCQDQLLGRCRKFLAGRPRSRRVPAVLWVMGQTASLQLDAAALEMGLVKYTASHCSPASAETWQRLCDERPESSQAVLAQWRLGELAMRKRDAKGAYDSLRLATKRLSALVSVEAAETESSKAVKVFSQPADVPALRYYAEALSSARRLVWLIERNDVLTDPASAEAMAALLEANPCDLNYYQRLAELAGQYEPTRLGDNLKLAVAMATPSLYERAEMLILLARDASSDAGIEANYELGRLAMRTGQAPALPLVENLRKPQEYFELVTSAPPNPWQHLAWEHLAALRPTTRAATTTNP